MDNRVRIGYGLCYQGSKNSIAEKLLAELPSAKCFVDLFGGGGAMAHCASLSDKYDKVIYNDADKRVFDLFSGAVSGKWFGRNEWCSRERFFAEKDEDLWIAHCFSFACNLKSYAWGKPYEIIYEAAWYAKFKNDFSKFHDLGININSYAVLEYYNNRDEIAKKIFGKSMPNFALHARPASVVYAGRIDQLKGLKVKCHNKDYREVDIPKDSVVYCDIPYDNTTGYDVDFSHKDFYAWALSREFPVYISSYNINNGGFTCIWETPAICKYAVGNYISRRTERLYVQNKFAKNKNLFA